MTNRPMIIEGPERLYGGVERRTRMEDKPWWRQLNDEEFRSEIAEMSLTELESLITELNAARMATGSASNDAAVTPEQRHRARRALVEIAGRRSALATEISSRKAEKLAALEKEHDEMVADARESIASGDLKGAVVRLLDWVDRFGQRRRRNQKTEAKDV